MTYSRFGEDEEDAGCGRRADGDRYECLVVDREGDVARDDACRLEDGSRYELDDEGE